MQDFRGGQPINYNYLTIDSFLNTIHVLDTIDVGKIFYISGVGPCIVYKPDVNEGGISFGTLLYERFTDDNEKPSHHGISSQYPTHLRSEPSVDYGYFFWDETNKRPVWWNGECFVESDGAKAGVARSGSFKKRPSGRDIYDGFQYFNTDTHTTITWADGKWWDTDGLEVKE